jgi:hypothetical protein
VATTFSHCLVTSAQPSVFAALFAVVAACRSVPRETCPPEPERRPALPAGTFSRPGGITGVVVSLPDGQPLEHAQVILQNTNHGALSGPTGRFFILGVPPGQYTVVAQRLGYHRQEGGEVRVPADSGLALVFALRKSSCPFTAARPIPH